MEPVPVGRMLSPRRWAVAVAVLGALGLAAPAVAAADSISGTVSDSAGTLAGPVCVTATSTTPLSSNGGTAAVGTDGSYTISDLADDSYDVSAASCNGGTDYSTSEYASNPVTVSSLLGTPDQSGVDFTLTDDFARITGTFADPGGTIVQDVCVTATPSGSADGTSPSAIYTIPAGTSSSATYTLDGLATGSYTIAAGSCGGGHAYDLTTATPDTSATDGTISSGPSFSTSHHLATITGTFSDPGGTIVQDVCVTATPSGSAVGTSPSATYTIPAGTGSPATYTLDVETGSYTIAAGSCGTGHAYSPTHIDPVVATDGDTTSSGTDFDLTHQLGTITGTVTDTAGTLVSEVCVTATQGATSVTSDPVTPGSDGSYKIPGLEGGDYTLTAQSCTGNAYSATPLAANPVTVADGDTAGGQDISLTHNLGTITGTITDHSTGQPIQGACVTVTPVGGKALVPVHTAADGTYTVSGLPAGTYNVTAGPCSGNAYVPTTAANPESVTWGQTLTKVDIALDPTPPPTTQAASTATAPSLGHYSADTTPVIGTLRVLTDLRNGLGPIRLRLSRTKARRLARRGWLSAPFRWTVGGRLHVYGTATVVVRTRHGRHHRTVTVLDGTHWRVAAGTGVVGIGVTRAGHRLLRAGRRVTLTITAIFTPADGNSPVAAQARARLR